MCGRLKSPTRGVRVGIDADAHVKNRVKAHKSIKDPERAVTQCFPVVVIL